MAKQVTTDEKRLPCKLVETDPKGAWSIWRDKEHYIVEVFRGTSRTGPMKSIVARVKANWTEAEVNLARHIIESLRQQRIPKLIPFALQQETVWRVARYLKRSHSGSAASLATYVYDLNKFFNWIKEEPDQTYSSLLNPDLSPNYVELKRFKIKVEDFVDTLQARGQANKTIRKWFGCFRTWLKVNELPRIHVDLPPRIVIYHDRSPTPEELSKWIGAAGLRERVAISFMALGGFRPNTLAKLRYRHVRQDLEKGVTPVHIHVEERITKGQYGDYDTFIGKEAVDYLEDYLNYRRRGSPCEKIPAEEIHGESPVLRAFKRKVEPMTLVAIKRVITSALLKSGLVKKGPKRRELRPYSLRKYFHTNLASAGVHRDYIDYFMGHVTPTYNSIKSKGIEFLRQVYLSSGLSIKPKTHLTKMTILKEMVRSLGYDPEKILVKETFTQPHRTVVDGETILRNVIREVLKKEV